MKHILNILSVILICLLNLNSCTEEPEVSMGSIAGFITEAPGGTEPLSGVTVTMLSVGKSTTTSSDGSFSFKDLTPGTYILQLSKSGYTSVKKSVLVVVGQMTQCDIQMNKETLMAEIEINPSSINFGTSQSDLNITIKNNGNTTAEWSLNLGDNPWLSVSQLSGSIQANRTQSITFTVDRNYLSEPKSVIVNLQAYGNSYPITVSCAPKNVTSKMVVEPTVLNFEAESVQQSFTIRNTGTSVLNWSAREISFPALSLSLTEGSIAAGGSSVVLVNLDRSLVSGDTTTTFIISDGVADKTMTVNVKSIGEGSGGESGEGESGVNEKLVVTNGLAAYYQFNDTYDDTMREYDAFGINNPSFEIGISGQGVKLLKSNDSSISIPYGLIHSKTFSISFWAKDLAEGLLLYSKCTDNYNRFSLDVNNGALSFIVADYNNKDHRNEDIFKFTHPTINDDKWHHIVITSNFDSTSKFTWVSTLYLDGKKTGVINENLGSSSGQYDKPNSFVIGGSAKFGSMYNFTSVSGCAFTVDNFRIYDTRELTASEIKEIFEAKQ